ncbi:MAG: adenylylsulfate kinase-like enzyme [Congregibacter sp.]|jgi:adenylylsulfate kinase-like enzyme
MVIWLVGLSGAGKTTIGQALYKNMKANHRHTVLIDGDEIREMFRHDQHDDAYSLIGRRMNAERIQAMCAWLENQDIDVVCCILSVFDEISQQNRTQFKQYFEVFVDTPLPLLIERDGKGLYQAALSGKTKNVVGIDLDYTAPRSPNLLIKNTMQEHHLDGYVQSILDGVEEMYGYH